MSYKWMSTKSCFLTSLHIPEHMLCHFKLLINFPISSVSWLNWNHSTWVGLLYVSPETVRLHFICIATAVALSGPISPTSQCVCVCVCYRLNPLPDFMWFTLSRAYVNVNCLHDWCEYAAAHLSAHLKFAVCFTVSPGHARPGWKATKKTELKEHPSYRQKGFPPFQPSGFCSSGAINIMLQWM